VALVKARDILDLVVIAIVHFLALILLPVATAAWCWRHFERPRLVPALLGAGIVIFALLLTIPAITHMCSNGQPDNQSLIPFVCALAVVLLVGNIFAKVGAVLVIWARPLALSFTFNTVVHVKEWIGVPKVGHQERLGAE
jgi:hypothetical protein